MIPARESIILILVDHARQYAGQWVALDGDRLIAHGPVASEVFDEADADGAHLPLITFVEHPVRQVQSNSRL